MKQAKITTRQGKGITLIALVVTIVILIILATISVNLVLNGGLVNRTQSGKEMHELERERERLELVKVDVASNTNHIGKVTVDTYVEELVNQGITVEDEIMDNGNGSKTVITDTGYSVLIEPVGENDVKITIEGKAGQLPPRIKQVNVTKGETSIEVKVIAIRTEGATYSYQYKEADNAWQPVGENKANIIIEGTEEEKSYVIKVTVKNEYGEDTKEEIVEAEDILPEPPTLSDGMIPVKREEESWIKTTKDDKEWYNYSSSQKKWANIVLEDSTFIKQEDGTEKLDTSKAYSQLVWIPRYAYQITSYYHTNTTGVGNINIVFIDAQNWNKSKTKQYSTMYPNAIAGSGTGMEDYVVHPAFDYGTDKINGFWIGKYETSHTECTTVATTGEYDGVDKIMQIKAGITSWRNMKIGNAFSTCLNMNKSGNPYGLNSNNSVVDPHLSKNTEWGAISYLTLSKYGNGKSMTSNGTSNFITGNSVNNSTTGNIYGVYDLSGCEEEWVAAYINSGETRLTNAETNGQVIVSSANKYKNVYRMAENNTNAGGKNFNLAIPSNNFYGDALWEIGQTGQTSEIVIDTWKGRKRRFFKIKCTIFG